MSDPTTEPFEVHGPPSDSPIARAIRSGRIDIRSVVAEITVHCAEPDCFGELEFVDGMDSGQCDTCRKMHWAERHRHWTQWSADSCEHANVKDGQCQNDDCLKLTTEPT